MTTAPKRRLGRSEVMISTIGLGCMGMSDFYGTADDSRSIALVHHALDQGMNFFDTADMYGPHTNEVLVGKALAGRRDEAVIATKFGVMRTPTGGWLGINGQPDYVRASCDGSLSRLGVDTIDLYYQHRVDPKTPIEETVGAMAGLVAAGKVRFLGLSEVDPDQIRRAHVVGIPGTTQHQRFDANLSASQVSLSTDELARLDQILPVGAAAETRY